MDKVEEWFKKRLENALDPDKALEIVTARAIPSEPYRLELIYDETTRTVTLQGDQLGLDIVRRAVNWLAKPDTEVGMRAAFTEVSPLTKSNVRLIIRRVESDEASDTATA
jgi:hypothetical protein